MLPVATRDPEVPVDFMRRLVKLRNAVELDDLAEFANQDTEQLLRLLLSTDGVSDPNQ
jgi:hypothetical protein